MAHPILGRKVSTSRSRARLLARLIGPMSREVFTVLLVDADDRIHAAYAQLGLASGTLNTPEHVEALYRAVADSIAETPGVKPPVRIVLAHNHNNGRAVPSRPDRLMTGRMLERDLPLRDDMIVATPNPRRRASGTEPLLDFYSFSDHLKAARQRAEAIVRAQ